MRKVLKYKDVLLDEFYLDTNVVLRRAKQGYYGRFNQHDEVKGYPNAQGYLMVQIPRKRSAIHKSHIVALVAGYQFPPEFEIDHIDGDVSNDHPSNLRVVNTRINACNRKKRSDNTSGITGIRWSEYHQHYVIRRTVNGKRLSRSKKTLPEAIKVLEDLTKLDSDYTTRHGK